MAFIIDGTTGIATVDGSVSAPSQRGQDSNSGISYGADSIKFSTNGVERLAITNSGVVGAGVGKILQVVSTTKTDVFTWGTTGDVAITGMSVTITPSSDTSKVLIQVQIGASGTYLGGYPIFFQLYKGGSQISGAKGAGSAGATDPVRCASYHKFADYWEGTSTSFSFLDEPATTSATTYALYGQRHATSGTAYFNATAQQINERYAQTISTIIAMEVAA